MANKFDKSGYQFKKTYTNPFKKPQKVNFDVLSSRRGQITKIILIGVLLIWGYIAFYSQQFDLRYIKITGTEIINSDKIHNLINQQKSRFRFLILPQNNIFIFDKNKLADNLHKRFGLKALQIKKNILDRYLEVNLSERTAVMALVDNDGYYYMDRYGYLITEIQREDVNPEFAQVFNHLSTMPVQLGQQILSRKIVESMLAMIQELKSADVEIASFNIIESPQIELQITRPEPEPAVERETADFDPALAAEIEEEELQPEEIIEIKKIANPDYQYKELTVITRQGWKIYFGNQIFQENYNLSGQLTSLLTVLNEKLGKDYAGLEYIDSRFGSRVYYK
ncbi:MAG TPA: hypothetical protein VGA49_03735 [Patescibacteria group bacterium]